MGKKVIILSTSTGATLGLYLAAKDPDIAAVVAWSANIDMADPMSAMLTLPWGLQLARLSMGSKYRSFAADSTIQKWWIHRYRIEGFSQFKIVASTNHDKHGIQTNQSTGFDGILL